MLTTDGAPYALRASERTISQHKFIQNLSQHYSMLAEWLRYQTSLLSQDRLFIKLFQNQQKWCGCVKTDCRSNVCSILNSWQQWSEQTLALLGPVAKIYVQRDHSRIISPSFPPTPLTRCLKCCSSLLAKRLNEVACL